MANMTQPGVQRELPLRVPYRMSVEKFEAAIAKGVFTENDRLELIEGQLVENLTKGNEHRLATQRVQRAISAILPQGWHLTKEDPVRIPSRHSEPEPDIAVVRGTIDDHADAAPGPPDVALVVEVSQSSVAADRALSATYLGGGIPVYWLLNLPDHCLEIYTAADPAPRVLDEGETAELVVENTIVGRVAVSDLLP
jgi:Uma2 family endonuclease